MIEHYVQHLKAFVVRELFDGDASELRPTTPLLAWGVLDSLSMLALLDFIDQELGIRVPDEHVRPEHFQNLERLGSLLAGLHPTPRRTPSGAYPLQGVKTVAVQAAGRVLPVAHAPGPRPGWLLVPGPLSPSVSWGAVLRAQVGVAATWAPSLIGLGPHDDGEQGASYGRQVEAMDQIAGAVAPDRPLVLVGSGLGGALAAEVARRRPGRVAALVVVGFGVLDEPWAWWQDQLQNAATYLERAFSEEPTMSPVVRDRLEALVASPAYRHFLTPGDAARLRTVFDDLPVPTLFVGACDDRVVRGAALEAANRRVAGSRLMWITGGGHLAHLERPQELQRAIRGFVEEACAEPAPTT